MKPISAFGMVSQKYLEEGMLQNNIVMVWELITEVSSWGKLSNILLSAYARTNTMLNSHGNLDQLRRLLDSVFPHFRYISILLVWGHASWQFSEILQEEHYVLLKLCCQMNFRPLFAAIHVVRSGLPRSNVASCSAVSEFHSRTGNGLYRRKTVVNPLCAVIWFRSRRILSTAFSICYLPVVLTSGTVYFELLMVL